MSSAAATPFPPHPRFDSIDAAAVRSCRAVPLQIVQNLGNGHAGAPLGLAPLAWVLFQRILRHDPADPKWPGRDRFVLSAGHASLLLYMQLFLAGYGLTLDDLAQDRMLDSHTPGHPEFGRTPGIEMSTGPLGQGVASAVGMALAARRERDLLDPERMAGDLFDPTVWVLAGDGCLQEGISSEASSLAGTLELDGLVLLWDDNRVTIDGSTSIAFSEDVRARYRAYGWRVLEITDVEDLTAVEAVLSRARERTGRPTLVAVRTTIGAPAPHVAGTSAAHSGGFGADETRETKRLLGFAPDAPLAALVPDEVVARGRTALERGARWHQPWDSAFGAWAGVHGDRLPLWRAIHGLDQPDWDGLLDVGSYSAAPTATRTTNGHVLEALTQSGVVWGGSADLSDSTGVASAMAPDGIHFGVREHAMAAILTGIALHAPGWRPYGSTYLTFSDYMRPAIRLAALMRLPVVYVLTHDSLAVGEDGPSHQPVEQLAGLRTVPHLDVVRPADAAETVAAWREVLRHPRGPVAFAFSRQPLPLLSSGGQVAKGAYVLWQSSDDPLSTPERAVLLLASGSEVSLALDAAHSLAVGGTPVRVVSAPCLEWFADQPEDYRDAVLPPSIRTRIAVEAGVGGSWWRWVGLDGDVIGVSDFGESGPGPAVMSRAGMTAKRVVDTARRLLAARQAD